MHMLWVCYSQVQQDPMSLKAHGHLLSHARLCAETIALIRRRTKEVMNQPEMIAWLKATHKPQLHDMDVRVRFLWLTCSDWLRCSSAFCLDGIVEPGTGQWKWHWLHQFLQQKAAARGGGSWGW